MQLTCMDLGVKLILFGFYHETKQNIYISTTSVYFGRKRTTAFSAYEETRWGLQFINELVVLN